MSERKSNRMSIEESIQRTRRKLEELSKPLPEILQDIARLYDIDKKTIYYVPHATVMQFAEPNVVAHVWRDYPPQRRALGILVAYDIWKTKYKNKNLALIMELLHEIGHIKLGRPSLRKMQKNLKNVSPNDLLALATYEMELHVERWVKEEWRKIGSYLDTKRTGWKRGMSFEDVVSRLKPLLGVQQSENIVQNRVPK